MTHPLHLSSRSSPLRGKEETAPPCRSEPLRYKVGGPSEVYASSGAAVFCAGWDRLGIVDYN